MQLEVIMLIKSVISLWLYQGKIKLITNDGKDKNTYEFKRGDNFGVHVPPTVWAEQKSINNENILLVIASEIYDESDYIRIIKII